MPLLGEIMVNFGSNVSGFSSGAAVVVAGIAGVGAAIGASVVAAGNFQAGMTSLVTGAGELQSNMGMVSSGILKMASDTGTSTDQLTAGMYMIESSGQHGARALLTLRDAAMGAKVGNADLGVVANGITTIMTDYASKNVTAAQATNTLIATVASGKTHMADLATALSNILPTSSAAGVSLGDTTAALATMTGEGTSAAQASTYLKQTILALEAPSSKASTALKTVGLTTTEVSTEMKKSLPDALQMITDAVGKKFPVGSAAYIASLKDIFGGTKQLSGVLELTGSHMATFKANVDAIANAVKQGGTAIAGWADVQGTFNFKVDQAKQAVNVLGIGIGTMLLPALSGILDKIIPVLSAFSGWVASGHAVSDMLLFFQQHAQIIIPVLSGIAAVLLAVLIPAVWSLAAGVIAATWPFVLIGAAVAGLVAIFMHFYSTSAPFKAFIDGLVAGFKQLATTIATGVGPAFSQLGTFMHGVVLPILQQIGGFLVATFKPVWDQLVATVQGQLIPVWNDLVKAIQPLLPTLQFLAEVIGGAVALSVIVLIAAIGGIIHAFASFLSGAIKAFGGIVEIVSGAIKVITGIISFFVDLVTGKWSKLGTDLGTIMNGIGTMFHGMWVYIQGIFQAAFGAIAGFCKGFGDTIAGIFHALSGTLVGHSIIPDMINAIVQWFASLPGKAASALGGLVGAVAGALANVASAAFSGGAQIVEQVASGIMSNIGGAIGNAMSAVGSFISSHLPASPAKLGPLRDLAKQGAMIAEQIATGINSSSPVLGASLNHLLTPTGGTGVGSASSGSQTIVLQLDGRDLAKALGPHLTREVRLVTQVKR